jgi:hypothetical protein
MTLTFTFLHSYNYNNHQDTAKPVYIEHKDMKNMEETQVE